MTTYSSVTSNIDLFAIGKDGSVQTAFREPGSPWPGAGLVFDGSP
jgi:hypothetical protein